MGYFSPTCSKAECGVKDDTIKKVLKGRQNTEYYMFVNHGLYLYRPYRTSLGGVSL
ncbi:hypothetical protein Barb7_02867 [Bacteroidales bacterium Barb7]|nr:hypothetical protein Barb7_02867 [Bacteroidales bacterium Barb7]